MRAAMLLPLCFAVGCALDEGVGTEETTATEESAVGFQCTVFRPVSWGTSGHICKERFGATVILQEGETFETTHWTGQVPTDDDGRLILGCSSTQGLYVILNYCP